MTKSRILTLTAFCLLALPAVIIHFSCEMIPEDDAYITYRYVANAADGHGLVYNVEEKVFGSSTPLYVGWLILLKTLFPTVGVDVLSVRGNVVPFLWLIGGVLALMKALCRFTGVVWCGVALIALHPLMLNTSISGMESMLFLALAIWSCWACVRERYSLAGLLAGAATLCRPEGIFVFASLGVWLLWTSRQRLLQLCWPYAICGFSWLIPATLYYGSPVPHSIFAKQAPLYPLASGTAAGRTLEELTNWLGLSGLPMGAAMAYSLTFFLVFCALIYSWFCLVERRSPVLIPLTFSTSLLLFYGVTNPLMMAWYWVLLLVPLSLVFICLWDLHRGVIQDKIGSLQFRTVSVVLVGYVMLVVGGEWLRIIQVSRPVGARVANLGRDTRGDTLRVAAYRLAAHWLSEHERRERRGPGRVAAPEIGAFGYYYPGRVLDTCGLVSPEAVPFNPVPTNDR